MLSLYLVFVILCISNYDGYHSNPFLPFSTDGISSLHFSWCAGCLAKHYNVHNMPKDLGGYPPSLNTMHWLLGNLRVMSSSIYV